MVDKFNNGMKRLHIRNKNREKYDFEALMDDMIDFWMKTI